MGCFGLDASISYLTVITELPLKDAKELEIIIYPNTYSHGHSGPSRQSNIFLDLTGMSGSFLAVNITPDEIPLHM